MISKIDRHSLNIGKTSYFKYSTLFFSWVGFVVSSDATDHCPERHVFLNINGQCCPPQNWPSRRSRATPCWLIERLLMWGQTTFTFHLTHELWQWALKDVEPRCVMSSACYHWSSNSSGSSSACVVVLPGPNCLCRRPHELGQVLQDLVVCARWLHPCWQHHSTCGDIIHSVSNAHCYGQMP